MLQITRNFLKDNLTEKINREYRTACNLAMGNAVLAVLVSFVSPVAAFIILSTRTIMFRISAIRFIAKKDMKA